MEHLGFHIALNRCYIISYSSYTLHRFQKWYSEDTASSVTCHENLDSPWLLRKA